MTMNANGDAGSAGSVDLSAQGDLTIGGAISIVTHIPSAERRMIGTVSTGSFSRRDLAFTADIPLSEKLLLGEFSKGDEIEVDVAPEKDKLAFRVPTSTTKA